MAWREAHTPVDLRGCEAPELRLCGSPDQDDLLLLVRPVAHPSGRPVDANSSKRLARGQRCGRVPALPLDSIDEPARPAPYGGLTGHFLGRGRRDVMSRSAIGHSPDWAVAVAGSACGNAGRPRDATGTVVTRSSGAVPGADDGKPEQAG